MSVRTEPRFTRDADLAVALPGDVEAEALIRTLQTSGYGIEAPWLGRVASSTELARARQSLMLITDRGYDRGRNLLFEMDALVS